MQMIGDQRGGQGYPFVSTGDTKGMRGRGWTEWKTKWKTEIIMDVMKSAGFNLVEYL